MQKMLLQWLENIGVKGENKGITGAEYIIYQ